MKQSCGGVLSKDGLAKSLQNSQKNIFARISFLIKLQARNLKLSESATGDPVETKVESSLLEQFCKIGVLRNLVKFTGKPLCQSLSF